MTFLERIAAAWKAAADFASLEAEDLNGVVKEHGPRSPFGNAQSDWISEWERCDAQAQRVQLLALDSEDA